MVQYTESVKHDYTIDPKRIVLGIALAVFYFMMLTNGEAFLGYWNENWTWNIIIYIIGVEFFILMYNRLPKDLEETKNKKHNIYQNIINFIFLFIGFWLLFKGISDAGLYFQGVSRLPLNMTIPTIVFQIGIVATSEEIIFRAVLFGSILHRHGRIPAYIVSSLIFGLLHFTSYGGSIQMMIIAIILGGFMAFLYEKGNLGSSIAFHGAFNCFGAGAMYCIINLWW